MKIFTVVGARPQFVKAAVVSRNIKSIPDIQEIIVHTGQHFDENMSNVFFKEMRIPNPTHQLNFNSLSHGKMTGRMLEGIEELLLLEKPDVVLVYGDTNSTLAGALAASKLHIPIAHVEAGLRSFNMKMPEEINRILTDRISKWLLCPTQNAIENLKAEGFESFNVKFSNVGDVMYDAALFYREKLNEYESKVKNMPNADFILATLHRQENLKDSNRLKNIIEALNHIHTNFHPIYLPIHPGTHKRIIESGLVPKFNLIPPVGYFDMIRLLLNCSFVMTDSGGLQKEAHFFSKYCITLRDETEWIELVENKINYVAGADRDKIIELTRKLNTTNYPTQLKLYGDGDAGQKILNNILK